MFKIENSSSNEVYVGYFVWQSLHRYLDDNEIIRLFAYHNVLQVVLTYNGGLTVQ